MQLAHLTPLGEVGNFIDDDQFSSGASQDKCGPETIALFWHSTPPGTPNRYTSADVHAMAHDDYQRFIGPDVTGDGNGTSDATLYNMLTYHRFHYVPHVARDQIVSYLELGYPVILGIVEASVYDADPQIRGVPYAWKNQLDLTKLSHIILATGPGDGHVIKVRDTANIGANGIVRPGPRNYSLDHLQLVSATVAVPSWLPAIPLPFDPIKTVNDLKAQQQPQLQAMKAALNLLHTDLQNSMHTLETLIASIK